MHSVARSAGKGYDFEWFDAAGRLRAGGWSRGSKRDAIEEANYQLRELLRKAEAPVNAA